MKRTVLALGLCVLGFVACSSDGGDEGDASVDAGSSSSGDADVSSSSGSSGASSSSGGSLDAGGDASICAEADLEAANDLLDQAETLATSFVDDACAEDITQAAIAERVQQAIDRCADARATYATGAGSAKTREALAGTITTGMLAGKTLQEALIGASIHSISPGVGPAPFVLTFTSATQVTSRECFFGDDDFECEDRLGSYSLTMQGGLQILSLDFLNAPQTPDRFEVTQDTDVQAPAFTFTAEEPDQNAYTFPELCSA